MQDLLARKRTLIFSEKPSNPLFFSTFKGVFQLKQARSYFEEHWSATDFNDCSTFPLQICNTDLPLIRIRFKSRHSNATTYDTYVQCTEKKFENSCCDCPSGNRQVGA